MISWSENTILMDCFKKKKKKPILPKKCTITARTSMLDTYIHSRKSNQHERQIHPQADNISGDNPRLQLTVWWEGHRFFLLLSILTYFCSQDGIITCFVYSERVAEQSQLQLTPDILLLYILFPHILHSTCQTHYIHGPGPLQCFNLARKLSVKC